MMKSIQVPVEVVRKATRDEISTETMHASLSRVSDLAVNGEA